MRGVYCESGASRSLIKIGVAEKAAPFLLYARGRIRPIKRIVERLAQETKRSRRERFQRVPRKRLQSYRKAATEEMEERQTFLPSAKVLILSETDKECGHFSPHDL